MIYDIIAFESPGDTNIHELKNYKTLEDAKAAAQKLIKEAYHNGGLAEIYDENGHVVETVYREDPNL